MSRKKRKKKKQTKKKQNESAQNKDDFRPFTNDFVFTMVMRDPDICKGIVELLLPDEEIGDIKIATADNSCIFYPLQTALIVTSSSVGSYCGVCEFLVFLTQLTWN